MTSKAAAAAAAAAAVAHNDNDLRESLIQSGSSSSSSSAASASASSSSSSTASGRGEHASSNKNKSSSSSRFGHDAENIQVVVGGPSPASQRRHIQHSDGSHSRLPMDFESSAMRRRWRRKVADGVGGEGEGEGGGAEKEESRKRLGKEDDYLLDEEEDDALAGTEDDHHVRFRWSAFWTQFFAHLCHPWMLPLYLIIGKVPLTMAQNQLFVPCNRVRSSYFGFLLHLITSLMFWFLVFVVVVLPDVRQQTGILELIMPMLLFVGHRLQVACKYAYLSKRQLLFMRTHILSRSEVSRIELIGGWLSISPLVCDIELRLAARRMGINLEDLYLQIDDRVEMLKRHERIPGDNTSFVCPPDMMYDEGDLDEETAELIHSVSRVLEKEDSGGLWPEEEHRDELRDRLKKQLDARLKQRVPTPETGSGLEASLSSSSSRPIRVSLSQLMHTMMERIGDNRKISRWVFRFVLLPFALTQLAVPFIFRLKRGEMPLGDGSILVAIAIICSGIMTFIFSLVMSGFLVVGILDYRRRFVILLVAGLLADPHLRPSRAAAAVSSGMAALGARFEAQHNQSGYLPPDGTVGAISLNEFKDVDVVDQSPILDAVRGESANPSNGMHRCMTFVDLTLPQNLSSWIALRQLAQQFGLQYAERISAYTSVLAGALLILLVSLITNFFLPAFTDGELQVFVLLDCLAFAVLLAMALRYGSLANQQALVHKDLLIRIQFGVREQLAAVPKCVYGTPTDGVLKPDTSSDVLAWHRVDRLLDSAIINVQVSSELFPLRVLGVPASGAVWKSLITIAATGLTSVYRLIHAQS